MEYLSAAWMEDHFKPVSGCDLRILSHMCVILLLHIFIGSSGDVFQNLSLGSHTMNVQLTPDGYCQALMQEISLDFTIFMPSKSSYQ